MIILIKLFNLCIFVKAGKSPSLSFAPFTILVPLAVVGLVKNCPLIPVADDGCQVIVVAPDTEHLVAGSLQFLPGRM
jgi:hypothetical protein